MATKRPLTDDLSRLRVRGASAGSPEALPAAGIAGLRCRRAESHILGCASPMRTATEQTELRSGPRTRRARRAHGPRTSQPACCVRTERGASNAGAHRRPASHHRAFATKGLGHHHSSGQDPMYSARAAGRQRSGGSAQAAKGCVESDSTQKAQLKLTTCTSPTRCGETGTKRGCPAMPADVSGQAGLSSSARTPATASSAHDSGSNLSASAPAQLRQ